MSVTQRDRIYWLLVLKGPLTLPEIRSETNWTTHRINEVLQGLKWQGCARLIERGQHVWPHPNGFGAKRCGKWEAIQDDSVALVVYRRYRQMKASA